MNSLVSQEAGANPWLVGLGETSATAIAPALPLPDLLPLGVGLQGTTSQEPPPNYPWKTPDPAGMGLGRSRPSEGCVFCLLSPHQPFLLPMKSLGPPGVGPPTTALTEAHGAEVCSLPRQDRDSGTSNLSLPYQKITTK